MSLRSLLPRFVLPVCFLTMLCALPAEAREVLSLDGPWQIVFDRENEGRAADWFHDANFPTDRARTIDVPSCWERIEKDYEGVAFYRRTFRVPESWKGKIVRLEFDAVNFLAEVWVNDTAVGCHEGGFTPFSLRVDPVLRPGEENTLIVRVMGPILLTDQRIEGYGPMETPQWRGAITGGIWQSVRLIATGDCYLDDVFIEPKLDAKEAAFHVVVRNEGEAVHPVRLDVAIRPSQTPDAKPVASAVRQQTVVPGRLTLDESLRWTDVHPWSPDDPFLYTAELTLKIGDTVSDRRTIRFGMREFTIRDKQFYLNGKPFFLKATFFEGLYPNKLAVPDSLDMARREILLAKQAGFNMIRPWRKPAPPEWLDLADEMGVLVVGSMAIECMDYPVETARLPGWVENEIRSTILRDRNRACIVQWELFNELKRPVLKQLLHRSALLARELDPTRLILDESGGWAQGANIYLPYQSQPIKFNDIHEYPGPQINDEVFLKLVLTGTKTHEEMRAMGLTGRLPGRNVVMGLMTFFSELGYGSLPNLVDNNRRFAESGNPIVPPYRYTKRLAEDHEKALAASGLDEVYPDLERFCLDQQQVHGLANRRMIEAVRCNPHVRGYCIHALVAGDWIVGAGLLDLFRNPKTAAYEQTKAANRPQIVVARLNPRNIYQAKGTTLTITGVNEGPPVPAQLTISILDIDEQANLLDGDPQDDTGPVVSTRTLDVELGSGISPLVEEKLDTSSLDGRYVLAVSLTDRKGDLIAENRFEFAVFPPARLRPPRKPIAVVDFTNRVTRFLDRLEVPYSRFSDQTPKDVPVFVTQSNAANDQQKEVFDALKRFAEAGGTVVYLDGALSGGTWRGPSSPHVPVRGEMRASIGLWTCMPHIVRKHPIFDGLPVECMMGPIYEHVWADRTLKDPDHPGKPIVGTVAFDWFPDYDLSKRHYYGPGDTWWGADVAAFEVGKGRCVLSHLRVTPYLGRDPVADRLLFNMIRWTTGETAP
ncbi:hypothetical protein JCM19992_35120 [Thermostilla marina]